MAPPKWDISISFLAADEPTAAAFYNALSKGLEVFFYPRSQEDLAGTNGLETMRGPFLAENSRVVLVLYRPPWGQTPWTGVEEIAIRDRCLNDRFESLFFVMLDKESTPPVWLPHTYVRFNYTDFGLEEAIGAIKRRVQERGGAIRPLTPAKRVDLYKEEQQYLRDKQVLRSSDARAIVGTAVSDVTKKVEALCAEIKDEFLAIEVHVESGQCHLRNQRVSMVVSLQWSNFDCELVVREFNRRLAVPKLGEQPIYAGVQPKETRATRFLPEINRARELGWIEQNQPSSFISCEALANRIVIEFVNLVERLEKTGPQHLFPAPRLSRRPRF